MRILPDESAAVDTKLMYQAQVQALAKALQSLPERDALALRMKYYECMGDAEIAAILNIKASAVRSLLSRVRRKVFELLREAES